MCCAVLRSLRLRCPCGLTVIMIVLLTRFCTCKPEGVLCHSYFVTTTSKNPSCCDKMTDLQMAPFRCPISKVCCKAGFYPDADKEEKTNSICSPYDACYDNAGLSDCTVLHDGRKECRMGCEDDKCGMTFQHENLTNVLRVYVLTFTGAARLGPLVEQNKSHLGWINYMSNAQVFKGVDSVVREGLDVKGCSIGVTNEPADNRRIRYVVQIILNTKTSSTQTADHVQSNWIESMTTSSLIDIQLPMTMMRYDFKLPCPAGKDERQGIHTNWPYTFAVGLDVRVLCSQEGGFNPQKFAVRTCQKDGNWSDDVDVTRCMEDIDECSMGLLNCTENRVCENYNGSFACTCDDKHIEVNGTCLTVAEVDPEIPFLPYSYSPYVAAGLTSPLMILLGIYCFLICNSRSGHVEEPNADSSTVQEGEPVTAVVNVEEEDDTAEVNAEEVNNHPDDNPTQPDGSTSSSDD